MSPARPQGDTRLIPTLENSPNNSSRTKVNGSGSTIQKKKSEVQKNMLKNHSDLDVKMLPAIDKQIHGENFVCVDCGKSFRLWSSLTRHTKSKYCVKALLCSDCGASFEYRSQLLVHQKVHTDLKPHECPTCGKHFRRKSSLNLHTWIHTGERRFVCNLCGKGFIARSRLRRHLPIHSGERSFKCDSCSKCFFDPYALTRHQKKHCPFKKETSHLVSEDLTNRALHAASWSEPPTTYMEAVQVCNTLSTPKEEVMDSEHCSTKIVDDAKGPLTKMLSNASGTQLEIISKDMKPLDRSSKLGNELHLTAERGGTRYWSLETPGPNIDMKGKVHDKCQAYLILILPPTKTSNIYILNTRTKNEKNTVKETGNQVNSNCDDHENITSFIVQNEMEKGILFDSVCDPYEGSAATSTSMVVYDGEDVSQHGQVKSQETSGNLKDETKTSQTQGAENKQKTCKKCGESFMYDCRKLLPHKCRTQDELFQCDCGKSFHQGFQLEQHQKTHQGHKSYKCQKCERAFKYESLLIQHLRNHPEDRLYPCTKCDRVFKDVFKIQQHFRVHMERSLSNVPNAKKASTR